MKKKRKIPKKSSFKFTDKKHSKQGIIATVIGIVCFISIIVLIFISGSSHGNGDLILGLAGDIVLLLSIVGFAVAVSGFKNKDNYLTYPIIGTLLNSLIFIILLILFLLGFGF